MAKHMFRPTPAFSNFGRMLSSSKGCIGILLGVALAVVPPPFAFGQINQQQQEQQQREEQQREQQAREQQQRDEQQREQQAREEQQRQQQQREQQQREEQAREQQQREQQQREQQQRDQQAREEQQRQEQQRAEQQREEQAREQQQREQQQRDQQAREEQQRQEQQRAEQQREEQAREQQQREQQQREQQAREQQQRDQEQRLEQERQRQTPVTPVSNSRVVSPPANTQVGGAVSPSQVSNEGRRAASPTQSSGSDHKTGGEQNNTAQRGQALPVPASDVKQKPCGKEPCAEGVPKPVSPDLRAKVCKDGPCPACAPGQSPGKHNCVAAALAKGATQQAKPNVVPQACPAGQIWNGVQCAAVGAQRCLPGQTSVGGFCQTDCTVATAAAQNYIQLLRMARQDKDSACLKNPTGQECQQAESTYDIRMNEYRNYLGGVPATCALPDPISI